MIKVKCPDCNISIKLVNEINTDWYGNLKYYKCKSCKERFVSINDGCCVGYYPHTFKTPEEATKHINELIEKREVHPH